MCVAITDQAAHTNLFFAEWDRTCCQDRLFKKDPIITHGTVSIRPPHIRLDKDFV